MPDPTGSRQLYQKTILASQRDFTETVKRINAAASALAASLVPIGQAARRAQAALEPLARQILDAERGSPLGRKRRARRARGRRRHA